MIAKTKTRSKKSSMEETRWSRSPSPRSSPWACMPLDHGLLTIPRPVVGSTRFQSTSTRSSHPRTRRASTFGYDRRPEKRALWRKAMTLGFPGPLDAAKAASCDRRRISPVMARDGIIGAQHPLVSSAGLRVLATGGNAVDAAVAAALVGPSSCPVAVASGAISSPSSPARIPPVPEQRGAPCLPRQRHRSPRRLARVHARAWPGCARRPSRDGAATDRSPRPFPDSSMDASRFWNDSAPGRSPSWPRRPSPTPRRGFRFRRPKRTAIANQALSSSASFPTSAAVFLPDGGAAADLARSCASPTWRARSRSSPAGVRTSFYRGRDRASRSRHSWRRTAAR